MDRERTPNFATDDQSAVRAPSVFAPSAGLLTAALAGLLAVGAAGCDEDENGNPICATPTAPPPVAPGSTGSTGTMDGGVHTPSAAGGDAGLVVSEPVEGTLSLAQLQAMCDARGGYIQVHASCAGANTCQGFSYHSGDPGSLTEHNCASANGCTGASCVVGPAERTPLRTGKEVYEAELPSGGPSSCTTCHAVWGEKLPSGEYPPPDTTKFKLFLLPGSTRNASNWLQTSAFEQEGVTAFGKIGVMPGGYAQVSMRGYHKLLSAGEIKRVVAHIRTLQPVIAEIPMPK